MNFRMIKIDDDLSVIHCALTMEYHFYVKNQYVKLGLDTMYDELGLGEKSKIYILEELGFLSVYTLLYMIHLIYERRDASIIILSDRIVQGDASLFFVSKRSSIDEWRKILLVDNSKQIKVLISYYYSICNGEGLTQQAHAVLLMTRGIKTIGSICNTLNLNRKQVSYYHSKLKEKLGLNDPMLFYNYLNWL
jgi:hypothetical protein